MKRKTDVPIYWTTFTHGEWDLWIAATADGLCYVGSPPSPSPYGHPIDGPAARFSNSRWIREDEGLRPYTTELIEYLQGARQSFAMPFDVRGTPFQLAVWNALRDIPYGQTRCYSDIAEQIGKPSAARAVGAAIGANPVLIAVPCHRVIGKSGALTGYRGGMAMKTKLLQLERSAK